jgi:5-methylthioadenosine/S-adenosylhomocysteine deaminase
MKKEKNSLLLNVLLERELVDISISSGRFQKIVKAGSLNVKEFDDSFKVVDATGLLILPPFYNAHTHAAMTLLRGFADDMPLFRWLSEYIWPLEKKLTAEDVYAGSRLAILEMIRSGTVFFADMYWHREETIRAAEEMGVRAAIGVTFAENLPHAPFEEYFAFLKNRTFESDLIQLSVMPHSIYTVGDALFEKCAAFAKEEGFILHTHLSETEEEVKTCLERTGKMPVEHLYDLGVLGENFVAAHGVHVSEKEMELLASSESTVVHNPASNLKLSSGLFKMQEMLSRNVRIALGTDGASSNNNLDMHEAMKFASLLAKRENPEILPAEEAFKMASRNGALAYGLDAGVIQEGALADALLVDLNNERLVPNYNLISNWVYSADSRSIVSVICNGRFIMENRKIDGEEEIIESAKKTAQRLLNS